MESESNRIRALNGGKKVGGYPVKKLDYHVYFDKVYGAFLGKTIVGTMGAPFEGVKMPLDLPFRREMIDAMLPNDDLDLQVLWLDVVEKYGADFTSYDLLQRFCECCDYSPGEYAVMRKNYARGIYPPLSGKFCNDFYTTGMGCPIRSEIWACLAPLSPERAADFAVRDGRLDHAGDSIEAECFFAALESAAFFESDLSKLIETGLEVSGRVCTADGGKSRFRELVCDVVGWCEKYGDVKRILRKILAKYGHPDCTNLYQNIGITLAAVLKGNLDIVRTGLDCINCGFDTDCTCATAGAIIGLIKGADALIREYDLKDVRYVLGVRSDRRSDSVRDLAEDIALLGAKLSAGAIENAPEKQFAFEKHADPLAFSVSYENDMPVFSPDKSCKVLLTVEDVSGVGYDGVLTVSGLGLEDRFELKLAAGERTSKQYVIEFPADERIVSETNLYRVGYECGGEEKSFTFGVVGALPWKVTGPIWRTDPVCTTELLQENDWQYQKIIDAVDYEFNRCDVTRRFHLNMAADTQTEFCAFGELFAPYCEDADTKYEESIFYQAQDAFRIEDFSGFSAPAVYYLSREMMVPEERNVFLQIGHSAPFACWLNGELLASVDRCDTWTAENVHLENVRLKAGVNRLVVRLTRVNADAKYNFTFARGITCAEHYTDNAAVRPEFWKAEE